MSIKMKISTVRKVEIIKIAPKKSFDILQQKFIEAAMELDASIVEPFIPEDMFLQNLDKFRFLAFLKKMFNTIRHIHPENYRVELANFQCNMCNFKKPLAGFEVFAGEELKPFERFAFYVETDDNGTTKDIYICNYFHRKENEHKVHKDDFMYF